MRLAAAIVLLVPLTAFAQLDPPKTGGAKKSDAFVKVTAAAAKSDAAGLVTVALTLKIEPGYHLYSNPVGLDDFEQVRTQVTLTAGGQPLDANVEYPPAKKVTEPGIGTYGTYEGEVVIKVTYRKPAGPVEAGVKIQACSKACYPVATVKVLLP